MSVYELSKVLNCHFSPTIEATVFLDVETIPLAVFIREHLDNFAALCELFDDELLEEGDLSERRFRYEHEFDISVGVDVTEKLEANTFENI